MEKLSESNIVLPFMFPMWVYTTIQSTRLSEF